MKHSEDENKYQKISELLKDLPEINAPANFETELSRRLAKEKFIEEKQSWVDKIFSPRLIPSAALAVTAVIILFLLKGSVGDVDDPFQAIPKLREEQGSKQNQPEALLNRSIDAEKQSQVDEIERKKESYLEDSNTIASSLGTASLERISVRTVNYKPDQTVIPVGGFNYRIVKLGENERRQLDLLREKIGAEMQNLPKN